MSIICEIHQTSYYHAAQTIHGSGESRLHVYVPTLHEESKIREKGKVTAKISPEIGRTKLQNKTKFGTALYSREQAFLEKDEISKNISDPDSK